MTSNDRELLRLLTTVEDGREAAGECFSTEHLVTLAEGAVSAEERAVAVAHLESCPQCSAELGMLFELAPWLDDVSAALAPELESHRRAQVPAHRTGSTEDRAQPGWRRLFGRRWLLAGAAPLLAAAAILLIVSWPRPLSPPVDGVVRSPIAAVSPAPDAVLEAPPEELRWPADPRQDGYRVRIFDAGGELLLERSVAGATGSLRLEETERVRLEAGAAYFWVVDAETGSSERIGPHWFRVTSPAGPDA